MKFRIKNIPKEVLEEAVKNSFSLTGCTRELGYSVTGNGSRKPLKKRIEELSIDTSHWTGQGWNKGNKSFYIKFIDLNDCLVENSTYSRQYLKKRLIKENLLKNECAVCKILEWQGKDLSLHIDHINGVNNDNRLENLRLLCPNCHSQTDTYAGKNKTRAKTDFFPVEKKKGKSKKDRIPSFVDKPVTKELNYCYPKNPWWRSIPKPHLRKTTRPEKHELEEFIKTKPFTTIAKDFGVSDTTIRKWCKIYNIGIETAFMKSKSKNTSS